MELPYAEAGLTPPEAAAHLLDRFAFGPARDQVDAVVAEGLDAWFARQLRGDTPSPALDRLLRGTPSVALSHREILAKYPNPGPIRRQATDEGRIDPDAPEKEQREQLIAYLAERGQLPQQELFNDTLEAKITHGVANENQLHEVMASFWFNHFTVSGTDGNIRRFLWTYEREAIRPHALGRFEELLTATAKHPAMLHYLDNANSVAHVDTKTTADCRREELMRQGGAEGRRWERINRRQLDRKDRRRVRMMDQGRQLGLNENYARELLELHTLGVDGGYTQQDVVEVARALTGWTTPAEGERGEEARRQAVKDVNRAQGTVLDGDFLFDPTRHDAEGKVILGRTFAAGRGLDEGEEVLRFLARRESTARFIGRKLAVQFVRDEPSAALVDALAETFRRSAGDTREVLITLTTHPEFWASRRAKIKTPYELVISSLRGLGAQLTRPRRLTRWLDRMGEPIYRAPAPTGFPAVASAWVNTGSLLHRMNFGLAAGGGFLKGVKFDPERFDRGMEPESDEAALARFASELMPGRDLDETIAALTPLLGRDGLADEIRQRADRGVSSVPVTREDDADAEADDDRPPAARNATPGQVLGLILGSPEYQRR